MFETPEAVVQRFSVKNIFLYIYENIAKCTEKQLYQSLFLIKLEAKDLKGFH